MNSTNITALYERLSRDDEQYGDSVSIVNQKNVRNLCFTARIYKSMSLYG